MFTYHFRRPFQHSLSSRKIAATQRVSSTTPSPTDIANSTTTQRSKFYRQRPNIFAGGNKPVDRVRTKRQVYGSFRNRYRSPATTTTTSTTPKTTTQRLRGLRRKDPHSTLHTSRTPSTSKSSRKYSTTTGGRRRLGYNSGSSHTSENSFRSGSSHHNSGSSHHNSGSSHHNSGSSYNSGSSANSRSSRQRTPTRGPSNTKRSRPRHQNVNEYDFVQKDDGRITITYNIAKQTAIPLVNGKLLDFMCLLLTVILLQVK